MPLSRFRFLLAPLSWLWAAGVGVRNWLFEKGWLHVWSFKLPVICVGNLAVGGTGKTPHVEYILHLLHERGIRTAMLSRGYGRRTRGFLLAKAWHGAKDIGDEPLQIFHNCPWTVVAVCEDRVKGIRHLLALHTPPEVIVLDDAFQHRYVKAGLNILLTEEARPYTSDHLLPWGHLREPASSAARADVIVLTKCGERVTTTLPLLPHQHLFYSRIAYGTPYLLETGEPMAGKFNAHAALLIAGIANPQPLADFLKKQGIKELKVLSYPDHHAFSASDILYINKVWGEQGEAAPLVFTTQKDAARLQPLLDELTPQLRRRLFVQPITVNVSATDVKQLSFNQIIIDYVNTHQRNRRLD